MNDLTAFIFSVMASIVANYICKWLDREKKKGDQPKKD